MPGLIDLPRRPTHDRGLPFAGAMRICERSGQATSWARVAYEVLNRLLTEHGIKLARTDTAKGCIPKKCERETVFGGVGDARGADITPFAADEKAAQPGNR